jgi:hypothetical protein
MTFHHTPFESKYGAVAIRLPKIDEFVPKFGGTHPVVLFASQGETPAEYAAATGFNEAFHVGANSEHHFQNSREKGPSFGSLPELYNLNRVIFILDCSGSMGDPVHSHMTARKIDYVREQINKLGDDYFPEGANFSLILFNSGHTSENFPAAIQGAFSSLKQSVSVITAGGGTEFSAPLECARQILLDDHIHYSKVNIERHGAPRSLIIFLSDGQDMLPTSQDIPGLILTQLRDLNATSFILGIGQDYSMPRIVGLSGHAGASSWSHFPIDTAALDPFDVQIPALIEPIVHCDKYFQFNAKGDFHHFSCVIPAIRFASSYSPEKVFPGYLREAAGVLYEKRDNLTLTLSAGRYCKDPDAEELEIPIVDVADAAHLFEKAQQASEFNKAARAVQAEDFHKRMVVLTALMTEDIDLLRALAEIDPSLQGALQNLEFGLERFKTDPNHGADDYYSSMTVTGNTTQFHGSPLDWRKVQAELDTKQASSETRLGHSHSANQDAPSEAPLPKNPSVGDVLRKYYGRHRDSQNQVSSDQNYTQSFPDLYSGNVGPLDNSSSVRLPSHLPDKLDPRKYDNLSPRLSSNIGLETKSGRILQLTELARGARYILGRNREHGDGVPIVIKSSVVSRRHAVVFIIGNELHITDLHSRAGTFVGTKKVPTDGSLSLQDGDIITMADTELKVKKK